MITLTGATGADFLTNGVKIADEVVVTAINGTSPSTSNYLLINGTTPLLPGVDYDNLLVTEIVSEASLSFDAYKNGVALGMVNSNLTIVDDGSGDFSYNIVHNYTKDEQVTNICAIASSYASKRTLLVWPPKADWLDADGNIVTLEGSENAAAVAAAMSNYPAQQSFTNLPFAGPHKLYYSNTYFTPAQLNRLSDAGVFVLVQDAVGANVYARHQKTTSTVSIQEQEFSITKAVDKLSLDMFSIVKPFIGKYNITPELLTQLDDITETYLFNAKSQKAAYCGSLIIGYTNKKIRANLQGQNTDLTVGTIEIAVTVEVGYPANYIDIKIYVQ